MDMKIQIQHFEGPFDLLLHLIKTHEMDILDIDIHQITSQYLGYIQRMPSLTLASEFLWMSATLLQIKSRMLLKMEVEEAEEDLEEDPRADLAHQLTQYQKYKKAAAQLYQRNCLGRDSFIKSKVAPALIKDESSSHPEARLVVPKGALLKMGQRYLKLTSQKKASKYHVKQALQSINHRIQELLPRFSLEKSQSFGDFMDKAPPNEGRHQVVVTLLSLLELAKQGCIQVTQPSLWGRIFVKLKKKIKFEDLQPMDTYEGSGKGETL